MISVIPEQTAGMSSSAPQSSPDSGLASAFKAFTTASNRLEAAYGSLESEVFSLRRALDATTAERDAAWQTVRDQQVGDVLSRHQRLAVLGEMAATLAHQIRTPLSATLLYASNATNPALAPARRDELLNRAIGCLHSLEQLVSDMLGFARGATASDAPVALADISLAVSNAAQALVRPGQQLSVTESPQNAVVCGNRAALIGAVLNLVSNALQAGGTSAAVRVESRLDGRTAEIRVLDNGPGVSPALRQRIFDPFYTSRADGTGLGLAVVKSVAEAHGGAIHVDGAGSQNDEFDGACFVLRLPLAAGIARLTEHQAA